MRKELLMCSPTEIAWHHTSVDVFAGPPLLTLPCMLWHPELRLCCAGVAGDISPLPGSCMGASTRR